MAAFSNQLKDRNEENQFVKLFDAVLQQNRGKLTDDEIAQGVEEAIEIFKKGITGSCQRAQYDNPKSLCGFFHRYSPLFAGTTRNRILSALLDCEQLNSSFNNPTLKMVDVGCGAGSDLVGLLSALYDGKCQFESLQVTAIDYNDDWKVFFDDTMEKLRGGNFGNASQLFKEKKIQSSYLSVDVFNYDWKELNDADIVLIKGLVSVFRSNSDRYSFIMKTVATMKPGSIFILIESPTFIQYASQDYRLECLNTSTNDEVSSSHEEHGSDLEDQLYFRGQEVVKYGPGIARQSNQQIRVFVKKQ